MSASNRSSGRKKGNKELGATSAPAVKQHVKSDAVKISDKEKKTVQLTTEQLVVNLAASSVNEINPELVQKIRDITQKTEEQVIAALLDHNEDEQGAINALVDTDDSFDWVTKNKKKKKIPAVVNSENAVENHNDESGSFDAWDDNKNASASTFRGRGSYPRNNSRAPVRGGGIRRGVNNRSADGKNRPWYGSNNNKENDHGYGGGNSYDRYNRDGGGNDTDRGDSRDYRGGRGRRIMNGPSRGRAGRGASRGGNSRPNQRTFQSNGTKDRGFFNQIDTWANPADTNNNNNKADSFPSTDDWDNEEYTGSLAMTQVFTPSAQTEVEPSITSPPLVIESATFTSENVVELKKDNQPAILPITMQPTQSPILTASMASIVAANNRLTPAQTQYLQQLTGQTSENRTVNQQQPNIQQQPPFQQQPTATSERQPSPSQVQGQQQPVASQQPQTQQQQHPLASPPIAQQPKTTPAAQQPQQSPSTMIYSAAAAIPSQTYSPTTQLPQPFPVISQGPPFLPSVSLPQTTETFASITISSQTFAPSSDGSNAFQQSPPLTAAPSYNGRTMEFTSSNYSDLVNNYNATHGLPNSANLSSRVKSQRPPPSSASNKVSSDQSSDVEISPTSDPASVNATMKLLDVQFGSLEFANSESYDNASTVSDATSISSLTKNFANATIGQPSPVNVNTNHADLSVSAFQSSNPPSQKHNLPPNSGGSIQSVLAQSKQMAANESVLTSDYPGQTIPSSRSPTIQELKGNAEISSLTYGGLSADSSYQNTQQPPFQKSSSVSSSSYHQSSAAASTYTTYGGPSQAPTSSGIYTNQHSASNLAQFSVYGGANTSPTTTQSLTTVATPAQQSSGYTNSSYQAAHHPAVVSTLQSYYSYPSSVIPPYQVSAGGGLTQATPYLGTQYGGPSLGAISYGATPFHTNYSVTTPAVTVPQTGKIISSSMTSVTSKESQYDNVITSSSTGSPVSSTSSVSSVTSVTSSVASLNLSQTTAAGGTTSASASTKATTVTTTASKTGGGILPGIHAGVAPIVGPQYIMSQGTMPLYSPTFINYDELQYMRGLHPHMTAGYLDMNYPGPQTNMPAPGREGLTVPFSSISDARFSRPDNTTSPVPPGGGGSLTQQNAAAAHQQPVLNPGIMQTYAAAYIYPYQQYSAPIYQVAATPTAPGHNTSNSAMTGPPFPKGPTNYSSASYGSQFDSVASGAQNNLQDYSGGKVNSSGGGYSGSQSAGSGPKGSVSSGGASQSGNAGNSSDLSVNMYGSKSHGGLSKVFHAGSTGVPPPFTGGTGTSASGMNNPPPNQNAGPYGNPLYLSGPPNTGQHHIHQSPHHQDSNDFRTSNMYPRSNYR